MKRARPLGMIAAAAVVALGLVACGSNDNGGVIQGPTQTTAPGAGPSTTAANSSGY